MKRIRIKYSDVLIDLDEVQVIDTRYLTEQSNLQRLIIKCAGNTVHYVDFSDNTQLDEAYKELEELWLNT
jgi:hypothetical protein